MGGNGREWGDYDLLEDAVLKHETGQFVCKVAGTIDEAKVLIETGFEYVCEFNARKRFRKRN